MKRRLLASLVTLTLLVSAVMIGVFAMPVSADYSSIGYDYTVTDGKATITRYRGSGGDITIPDTLGGYPVTRIYEYYSSYYGCYRGAFKECTNITSVIIPDSVTTIGSSAFSGCTGLTSVTIPDSVTTIGSSAFSGCTGLTAVTIPDSVTTIGSSAFYGCTGLTSLTIGAGVTYIYDYAFYGCTRLTAVTIPDKVTTIGKYAFYDNGLKLAVFGKSVTTIGEAAFYRCALKNIVLPTSVTNIGSGQFKGNYSTYNGSDLCTVWYAGTEEQAKNNSIHFSYVDDKSRYRRTEWQYNTFYDAGYMYSVKDGNATIERCVDGSTELTIPKKLGGYPVTAIADSAFYNCDTPTAVTIPDSVTTIGEQAFYDCSKLAKVTLGKKVKTIGVRAFYDCDALTAVTIPDSVTKIDGYAFYDCDALTAVTIPDSVTTIGVRAFEYCSKLAKVTLGKKVKTIGEYAFNSCDALTAVYINDLTAWCGIDFTVWCSNPLSNGATLYLNKKAVTKLTIPSTVKTIKANAFYGCKSITSVTIPDSVTTIGVRAFYKCSKLAKVTLGKKVKTIGVYAFYNCDALTAVTIPDSVTKIDGYAFYDCDALTAVTIPDSVTTIGERAFYDCSKLAKVTLGKKVKTIGEYAFYNCDALTAVTIPDSVTTIGYSAFDNCSKLAKVTLGKNVKTIASSAFYRCNKLKTLVIPDSVTSLSFSALPSSLTSLTIGKGITSFSKGALDHLTKLQSLTIPFVGKELNSTEDTHFAYIFGEECYTNSAYEATCVPKSLKTVTVTGGIIVDNYAFCNCSYIETVHIRDGVKQLGYSVFQRCLNLKTVSIAPSVNGMYSDIFYYCPSLETVYCTAGTTAYNYVDYYDIPYRALDTVKLSKTAFTYNGKTQKPTVVVKDTTGKTISSSHYTVTYPADSKAIGTYKVKVTFKGYFTGTKTLTYKINPINVSTCKVSLSATEYTYTGSVKKPTVTVKNASGTKLKNGTHYTVTYASGRKNVGTYKVTVKMKGIYSGTKTLTFKINPVKTTLSSLTAGSKKLTVKWSKKSTQVTGYQIQYSTSKSFKSYKTKNVTSYKTVSTSLTGLKAKTTYYVRVRTYKTVNGIKLYSGWSTIKYKKTK